LLIVIGLPNGLALFGLVVPAVAVVRGTADVSVLEQMIVLVAVGVMNVAAMAGLAAVVFAEKLWRYGKPFGQAVGVLLVAVGVLAVWFPWLLPGLHASAMPGMPAT